MTAPVANGLARDPTQVTTHLRVGDLVIEPVQLNSLALHFLGVDLPHRSSDQSRPVSQPHGCPLPRGRAPQHKRFGDLAAVWGFCQQLGVADIVDEVVGGRRSDVAVSVGTYLTLATVNRVVDPCSKRAFAEWWDTTDGPSFVRPRLPAGATDFRRFWDAMDTLTEQQLAEIERRIAPSETSRTLAGSNCWTTAIRLRKAQPGGGHLLCSSGRPQNTGRCIQERVSQIAISCRRCIQEIRAVVQSRVCWIAAAGDGKAEVVLC